MALTKLITDLIDGSLGTDWQATPKTANFTAVAGEGYFVDTTSAAITVTLPSSPTAGDGVSIVDYAGTADTNNITITSSDNINGLSNDFKIDYERGGVSMVYVDATQGWIAYNATNETDTALVPDIPLTVDYLLVAGGGGTGYGRNTIGAGAGGLRTSYGTTSGGGGSAESSLSLLKETNYIVTVGAGGTGSGAGTLGDGTNGQNSVFSTITSIGGGRSSGNSDVNGADGGSGGGGGYDTAPGAAGSGTTGQGFDGGTTSGDVVGGSGGGAGGAGTGQGAANSTPGGAGLSVSITGSTVTYASGGGSYNASGTANTGNGAGNGATSTAGGYPGGSGVVILRYPDTYTVTIGAGLTGSTATDGSDKVTTFTAGTGNISFS